MRWERRKKKKNNSKKKVKIILHTFLCIHKSAGSINFRVLHSNYNLYYIQGSTNWVKVWKQS